MRIEPMIFSPGFLQYFFIYFVPGLEYNPCEPRGVPPQLICCSLQFFFPLSFEVLCYTVKWETPFLSAVKASMSNFQKVPMNLWKNRKRLAVPVPSQHRLDMQSKEDVPAKKLWPFLLRYRNRVARSSLGRISGLFVIFWCAQLIVSNVK